MTRDASCRQSLELAHRGALVAVFALHGSVRSQQREPVHVILYLLYGNIPALYRVAFRAIRTHLAVVHIHVAVLAILSYVSKNRLNVALFALHLFVHATQRIPSFVVVKFGHGSNGLPGRGSVTVLAGHREGAVRALSRLLLSSAAGSISWLPGEEQEPTHDMKSLKRNGLLDYSDLRTGIPSAQGALLRTKPHFEFG